MIRGLAIFSVVVGVLACGPAQKDQATDVGYATVVYSSYQCGQTEGPVARWLEDQAALRTVMTGLGSTQIGFPKIEPPEVDFARDYVVLIDMGQRPTGGYALKLAQPSVAVEEGTATVRVDWIEPPPGAFVTQALTSPCLVLAVPRGDYSRLRVVDQTLRTRFELPAP